MGTNDPPPKVGIEPTTTRLKAERSSELSYSGYTAAVEITVFILILVSRAAPPSLFSIRYVNTPQFLFDGLTD